MRRLFAETLEPRVLLTSVTSVDPPSNSHNALPSTIISATFDQEINSVTATPDRFAVYSSMRSGPVTVSAAGNSVTANPASDFFPGELVQVTATARIESSAADPVAARVWQFRTAAFSGSGLFSDTGQSLGDHDSSDVSLGDLDGDGDLDAFVANQGESHGVWLNDGNGTFHLGQPVTNSSVSGDVILGDLDGDGDLDAFLGNQLWLNDGTGVFQGARYSAGFSGASIALGDLDGDGDLDAFHVIGGGNRVSSNMGQSYGGGGPLFSDSGQRLGDHSSTDVSLGDLDGDGDLDAFVTNGAYGGQADRIWLNDGSGEFTDSGQQLSNYSSLGVALGDLDGDGDLDAFVTEPLGSRIWLNNGSAGFSGTGLSLSMGAHLGTEVALGDLDGDGDLDAFTLERGDSLTLGVPNRVWLNNGSAEFSDSGQSLGDHFGTGIALGDLDGDGDLDAFVANRRHSTQGQRQSNRVWMNQFPTNQITLSVDNLTIVETSGVATVTATSPTPSDSPITVSLAFSGTAASADDYTTSASEIVIAAGATTGSITIAAVDDTLDEQNETVVVDIIGVAGAVEAGTQQVSITIEDDDAPQGFRLSSFAPTSGGFKATLSDKLDTTVLNLGNTQIGGRGPADVTLVGASTGAIAGSLVVSGDGHQVEFLATGNRLAADTYTITLRSADDGFKDTSGNLLDGNGDGTAGDDFSDNFTVANNTSEIGVQDSVRGPGQELNLPANSSDGLPITIDSDGAAIRNASFAIDYNPNLLDVTAVVPGASMPAGSTAAVDASTPGRAVVTFNSPTDLPAGPNTLVNLQADVPTNNAAAIYGERHVLDINSIVLTNAAGTELPAVDNDGLHVAAFFGDVSGNGGINASDASQVARVAASLVSGFAEFLLTDPMIVGDISGNGVINATDASMVARHAVELPVDEIPPIPGRAVIADLTAAAPRPDSLVAASVASVSTRTSATTSTTGAFAVPGAVPNQILDAGADREYSSLGVDEDALRLPPPLEEAVENLLTALLAETS